MFLPSHLHTGSGSGSDQKVPAPAPQHWVQVPVMYFIQPILTQDKHCGDEYVSEFEDGAKKMVDYIRAMEREIAKRKQVIFLIF